MNELHFALYFGWTPRITRAGVYAWRPYLFKAETAIGGLSFRLFGFYLNLFLNGFSGAEAERRRLEVIVLGLRDQQAKVRATLYSRGEFP